MMKSPTVLTAEPNSIPEVLNRHLSANSRDDIPGVASYIDRGAELITPEAINALRHLRQPLHAKIDALPDSAYLPRRLRLLATFFEEACTDGHYGTVAHRDVTFALLYFLKGFDRIPDSIPDIGLLDDAMVVQIVLQRYSTTFRAHWLRRRRAWPAEL